ncbi:MAG: D-alanyl-D-alanine carboxypeptidase family protein [Thermoleophilia bacterium]|nr:D-alanyl-D-alanine carboxypeptidase family protein [Thermoleophilia bacterium]
MDHRDEHGGTSILVLGILLAAAFLLALLTAVGGAYVAHAELQQAADIAAAVIERSPGDDPHARAAALASANGARDVKVEEAEAGTRLRIRVRGRAPAAFGMRRGATIEAIAYADLPPPSMIGDYGPNPPGQYSGPLELAGSVPVCPAVAAAFRRMDAAARIDGIRLIPTSGFRTYAEQAALYAQLGPAIAAPPGASRHHDATELDIAVGPAGSTTHRWLQAHGPAFGFIQRYSWEPWHWGFVAGC